MSKTLSKDVTFLTELNCQLVDAYTRNRIFKDSFAVKITPEQGVTQLDSVLRQNAPITLQNIQQVVLINAWGSFGVNLTQAGQTISINCNGIFLMYGPIDAIQLVTLTDEDIRIRYIVS